MERMVLVGFYWMNSGICFCFDVGFEEENREELLIVVCVIVKENTRR